MLLRGQDRSRLTMDGHFGKGSSFPSVLRRIIDSRFFCEISPKAQKRLRCFKVLITDQ